MGWRFVTASWSAAQDGILRRGEDRLDAGQLWTSGGSAADLPPRTSTASSVMSPISGISSSCAEKLRSRVSSSMISLTTARSFTSAARKSVVSGKSETVGVDLGGGRSIKKKHIDKIQHTNQ